MPKPRSKIMLATHHLLLLQISCATGFQVLRVSPLADRSVTNSRSIQPSMGLFDGLKGAFANDDTLGKRENAGLSKEATKRTVTWVGPNGQKKMVPECPSKRDHAMGRLPHERPATSCCPGICSFTARAPS